MYLYRVIVHEHVHVRRVTIRRGLSSNVRGRNTQPYPQLSYWSRCTVYARGTCVLNLSGQKSVRDRSTVVSVHFNNSHGQGYIEN